MNILTREVALKKLNQEVDQKHFLLGDVKNQLKGAVGPSSAEAIGGDRRQLGATFPDHHRQEGQPPPLPPAGGQHQARKVLLQALQALKDDDGSLDNKVQAKVGRHVSDAEPRRLQEAVEQSLQAELREVSASKDHLKAKLAKAEKMEARLRSELEGLRTKLGEAEVEVASLKQKCCMLEREQRQREAVSASDSVRINRQVEQLAKLQAAKKDLCNVRKELETELASSSETSRRQLAAKDKQIEQLVDGFQKQMKLIDVLRRQKLHLEAAHILQYTEDEFLQTLNWRLDERTEDNPQQPLTEAAKEVSHQESQPAPLLDNVEDDLP